MRVFRFLNLAILSVLLAGSAALYAQDDKATEDKPARQEDPKAPPRQDEAKPQGDVKPSKDEAKPAKQDDKQEQKQEQKDSRDQMKPEGQDHPAVGQQGRPGGNSARIPDDKFKAHFGRGHTFKAQGVIVQGQTQFQYGGYSFTLVDPWPVGWGYGDDCYIDYIDGEYFLFDLLHPGVRIAIIVVL